MGGSKTQRASTQQDNMTLNKSAAFVPSMVQIPHRKINLGKQNQIVGNVSTVKMSMTYEYNDYAPSDYNHDSLVFHEDLRVDPALSKRSLDAYHKE